MLVLCLATTMQICDKQGNAMQSITQEQVLVLEQQTENNKNSTTMLQRVKTVKVFYFREKTDHKEMKLTKRPLNLCQIPQYQQILHFNQCPVLTKHQRGLC